MLSVRPLDGSDKHGTSGGGTVCRPGPLFTERVCTPNRAPIETGKPGKSGKSGNENVHGKVMEHEILAKSH